MLGLGMPLCLSVDYGMIGRGVSCMNAFQIYNIQGL